MSATLSVPTSARHGIPASIILPPRELKHYRRWQHLYTKLDPAKQGYLPTATEYEDFQQWLKRQDSGYFSDIFEDLSDHIDPTKPDPSTSPVESPVASICHHAIHPIIAGQLQPRCPVCTIDVHLNYVKVLSQALQAAGGRAPSCTLTASEHQDIVYSAWCRGKICTLKELLKLEDMADKEAAWFAEHPDLKFDKIQTATKALELYWFETHGLQEVKPIAKRQTTVLFSGDTCFEPGRPQAYYWKRSPRYEPGKYTITGQQDEEEDIIAEDSEDYSPGAIFRFSVGEEQGGEESAQEPLQVKDLADELEEDDDDSEWEDIDSDDGHPGLEDEESEGSYIDFEVEEECSFIVFADD